MTELAHAASLDPVAFRLQNIANNQFEAKTGQPLTWDRWRKVLTEVARISGWQPRVAASSLASGKVVRGRGIALGGFGGTPVPPVQVHTIVAGGMPGWQITLIAIGAALLAATVAVFLDRARAARRKAITAAT